jgi:hypothetical protein
MPKEAGRDMAKGLRFLHPSEPTPFVIAKWQFRRAKVMTASANPMNSSCEATDARFRSTGDENVRDAAHFLHKRRMWRIGSIQQLRPPQLQ